VCARACKEIPVNPISLKKPGSASWARPSGEVLGRKDAECQAEQKQDKQNSGKIDWERARVARKKRNKEHN
jgi:hypothetical protein